jgi:hypothetical protein
MRRSADVSPVRSVAIVPAGRQTVTSWFNVLEQDLNIASSPDASTGIAVGAQRPEAPVGTASAMPTVAGSPHPPPGRSCDGGVT